MGYLQIAILATVFGAGFYAGFDIQSERVDILETARDTANGMAEQQLQSAIAKNKLAEMKAVELNQQIEKSHDQNVLTINSLVDRVRYTSRANCPSALSETADTSVSIGKAADDPRLAEFSRLAGKDATYAEACWKVIINNCGVEQ